ncbi:hypothetical protein A2U01_0109839, partial [Trifolium medium]|nr:hypothetical protein [Trifolium medium]
MVVGGKIFMRTEGIPRDEGMVNQHGGWWEVVTTINLKAMWRLLDIAFENWMMQENGFDSG